MRRLRTPTAVIIVAIGLLCLSIGAVAALDVEPTHEYTPHDYHVEDIVYDAQHDMVWSIDNNPEARNVSFVGYEVGAEEVVVEETLNTGHALAVGNGVVYVADNRELIEYNVSTGETSLLTKMEHHVGDMDYDDSRDLVWVANGGDVVAFAAADGSEVMRHDEHGDKGIESISVAGDYVASVETWDPNVTVYDIEAESVVFEPLPDTIAEKGDDGNLASVHVTESAKLVIGGGWDSVFLYDIESQELQAQYAAHAFGASEVRYHESEELIVSTGTGNRVAFYDVTADSIVQTYDHGDTIFAADLDVQNDVLWFGDGEQEQTGTMTGLQVSFEEPTATPTPTAGDVDKTPTPTAADVDGTPTPTAGDVDATPTPTVADMDETPTPTAGDVDETPTESGPTDGTEDTPTEETTDDGNGASSPGMGIFAAVIALSMFGYLFKRRQAG